MKIDKILIVVILLVGFLANIASGQNAYKMPKKDKFEFGIFVGASNYEGDLEENAVNLPCTQLGVGGFVRYNLTNNLSLRFGMDYGNINDADSLATSYWRRKRNLSFRSTIIDGYLGLEYYFANWAVGSARKTYISPFLFGGIGAFNFNPQAYYQGVWYDLQPLGTEGQGTLAYPDRQPYALTQIYIPFGGGLRVNLGPTWFLSLECRASKTFTDYLDDVSLTYASPEVLLAQHGYLAVALANRSEENGKIYPDQTGNHRGGYTITTDWYFFTGITISHTFKSKSPCYSF